MKNSDNQGVLAFRPGRFKDFGAESRKWNLKQTQYVCFETFGKLEGGVVAPKSIRSIIPIPLAVLKPLKSLSQTTLNAKTISCDAFLGFL